MDKTFVIMQLKGKMAWSEMLGFVQDGSSSVSAATLLI